MSKFSKLYSSGIRFSFISSKCADLLFNETWEHLELIQTEPLCWSASCLDFFTLNSDSLHLLDFSYFHFFLSVLSSIFIDSARMWLGVTTRPPQVPFPSPNLIFHFMHTSHIFCHIHCGGLSLCQRHKCSSRGDWNEKKKWKEVEQKGAKNRVGATSKQTEQEPLASFPTMGPCISCDGYLAAAAAAKATPNAPLTPTPTSHFRQDPPE